MECAKTKQKRVNLAVNRIASTIHLAYASYYHDEQFGPHLATLATQLKLWYVHVQASHSTMKLLNALPQSIEECEALETLEFEPKVEHGVTDDDLAEVVPYCPNLKHVYLRGIPDLSDRTLYLLGQETDDLIRLDISRCRQVSATGVRDIVGLATKLQVLRLRGVWTLTDTVVTMLVRSLGHLTELDISDLPLVTAHSVREIWTFSRKLRTLNVSDCVNVTNKGFPSPFSHRPLKNSRKLVVPLKPSNSGPVEARPVVEKAYKDDLQPLILPGHHVSSVER